MVIQTLHKNTKIAQEAIRNLARNLNSERKCECDTALATALITDPKIVTTKAYDKLRLLIHKYYIEPKSQ